MTSHDCDLGYYGLVRLSHGLFSLISHLKSQSMSTRMIRMGQEDEYEPVYFIDLIHCL